jgi:hypothetical protein
LDGRMARCISRSARNSDDWKVRRMVKE